MWDRGDALNVAPGSGQLTPPAVRGGACLGLGRCLTREAGSCRLEWPLAGLGSVLGELGSGISEDISTV
jgi:hypothetical protein